MGISREQRRVVVVGGGLAGLAATVWLAELGYAVTLVESNGSLGGRTIGLTSGHGDTIENGQHVLAGSYECIFRYLDSVGTRHLLEFPDEFGVRYPDGHVETFGLRARNARRIFLGQVRGLGLSTLLRAAPAWGRLVRDVVRFDDALDAITVDEWLDRLEFPAAVRRIMLNSMVIGLLNELPHLASAHAFAALLRTGADRVRRGGSDAMRIGYPTVDLETLYLNGARRVMAEHGVDVRLRTRAVSVVVDGGRASGVRLADGATIDADAVVLAVPSWAVRSLLDDVPGSEDARLAAKQLEPIPIMNAYVLMDRPLGTVAPWESLLDSDIGWVFDRDRMHGPRRGRQPSVRADHLRRLRPDDVEEPGGGRPSGRRTARQLSGRSWRPRAGCHRGALAQSDVLLAGGYVHHPAGKPHGAAQPCPGRRLDTQRLADHHGRCGPKRFPCSRSRA